MKECTFFPDETEVFYSSRYVEYQY